MNANRGFAGHLATVVVLTSIAAAVLFVGFRLSGALSLGGTYDVKAVVPQAGSLTQGTSVTMAGVRVGTISRVQRRGVGALIDIRLDDKRVTPLPVDSRASLSVRTPLGENYIKIEPGRSQQTLASGGTISSTPADRYVDIDQILSAIAEGKPREGARKLIRGLGYAVNDRGPELNQIVDGAAGVMQGGSAVARALEPDSEQIGQLVDQLGHVSQAVGERGESIRQLARAGRAAFTGLAARDRALRSLLRVLPSTLSQVRKTTGTLQQVSTSATPVLLNTSAALRELRPSIRRLSPAAADANEIVRQLDRAAPKLQHTLAALTTAAPGLRKTLPVVKQVLCETNPALRYLKPYTRDILSFIEGFGASSNAYDAIGHTIQLAPVENEMFATGLPAGTAKPTYDLVHAGFLQQTNGLSWEPFPKPGQANDTLAQNMRNASPDDVAKSGYVYPRVKADC